MNPKFLKIGEIVTENLNTGNRRGQAVFNAVHQVFPNIADQLRGTEADCFHDNQAIEVFLLTVGSMVASQETGIVA